jgi:hypothetical protein
MFKKLSLIFAICLLLGCASVPQKPNDSGYLMMYNGYPYPGNMLFEYQTTTVFKLPNQNASNPVYLNGDAIVNACKGQTACVINIFMDFQHRFLGDVTIDATKGRVVASNSQDPNLKFYNLYYLCYYSPVIPCNGERKTRD